MIPADWLPVLRPILHALQSLGVAHQIGGSLASSAWGLPRSTQDADLAADLRLEHVAPLVARLQDEYYKVQGSALDAAYLREWASTLGVGALLSQAWSEAGLS